MALALPSERFSPVTPIAALSIVSSVSELSISGGFRQQCLLHLKLAHIALKSRLSAARCLRAPLLHGVNLRQVQQPLGAVEAVAKEIEERLKPHVLLAMETDEFEQFPGRLLDILLASDENIQDLVTVLHVLKDPSTAQAVFGSVATLMSSRLADTGVAHSEHSNQFVSLVQNLQASSGWRKFSLFVQELKPSQQALLLRNCRKHSFLRRRIQRRMSCEGVRFARVIRESFLPKVQQMLDVSVFSSPRGLKPYFNVNIASFFQQSASRSAGIWSSSPSQDVDCVWRSAALLLNGLQSNGLKTPALERDIVIGAQNLVDVAARHDFDPQKLKALLQQAMLPEPVLQQLEDFLVGVNFSFAGRWLKALSNEAFAVLVRSCIAGDAVRSIEHSIEHAIDELNPYEDLEFYRHFVDKLCLGLGNNKTIQSVARVLTQGYYQALTLPAKRKLILDMISPGGPELLDGGLLKTGELEKLVLRMVQAGGPCFQKAMQLFKNDIPVKSLQRALDDVNSHLAPLPSSVVRSIILEDFRQVSWHDGITRALVLPESYVQQQPYWPSVEEVTRRSFRCLGSASIGQTHLAFVQVEGPEGLGAPELVALKIQRPQIAQVIREEMAAMKRIQGLDDHIRETLGSLERAILAETSFSREAAFAKVLQPIYTPFKSAECTLAVVDIMASSPKMLVEKYVAGKSVSQIIRENADLPEVDQAAFLHRAGKGLSLLVSAYAKATITGDQVHQYQLRVTLSLFDTPKKAKEMLLYCGSENPSLRFLNHKCELIEQAFTSQDADFIPRLLSKAPQKNGDARALFSVNQYSDLCREIRGALGDGFLFQGESFVDSDRHSGNLLYQVQPTGPDVMTVIDTGAGCVVTLRERQGMIKLAVGISCADVDIVLQGLEALIPDLEHRTEEVLAGLKQSVSDIILGKTVQQEKLATMYHFLLLQGVLDSTQSHDDFFKALLDDQNIKLCERILNTDQPVTCATALKAYLGDAKSRINAEGDFHEFNLNLDRFDQKAFAAFIEKSNFQRMVAVSTTRSVNPAAWIADGHNALLFVNTLRQVANALDTHKIGAPEVVLQVNRGTKFVEDQIREVNDAKQQLREGLNLSQSQLLAENLSPVSIGPAYVWGVAGWQIIQDAVVTLGFQAFTALHSLLKERAGVSG